MNEELQKQIEEVMGNVDDLGPVDFKTEAEQVSLTAGYALQKASHNIGKMIAIAFERKDVVKLGQLKELSTKLGMMARQIEIEAAKYKFGDKFDINKV